MSDTFTRRDVLKGTATTGIIGTGVALGSGSATATHDRDWVEVRFWVHESVPKNLMWSTWNDEFGGDSLLQDTADDLQAYFQKRQDKFNLSGSYVAQHAEYTDPTTGYLSSSPSASELRSVLPDWARDNEEYMNLHIIYNDGDHYLGKRQSSMYQGDGKSGEAYVDVGFTDPLAMDYLFPNLYLHETFHGMIADHSKENDHGLGTPAWNFQDGMPTVMGTAYAQQGANWYNGTEIPDTDCYGEDWDDGTTWGQPTPLYRIMGCTDAKIGEFFNNLYENNYTPSFFNFHTHEG